jgi:methionine synthase II (cobalamin-independent)
MSLPLLPTTVVGSYPQPDWLIDRERLGHAVPRVRSESLWRVAGPYLAEAQDDATLIAIRDMERAGIDIITDGEARRESYSNHFANALDGIDSGTGGEEFVILLRNTSLAQAVTFAEDLRRHIETMELLEQHVITISAGLAEYDTAEDIDQWLKRADIQLYQAKQNGRNRVCPQLAI